MNQTKIENIISINKFRLNCFRYHTVGDCKRCDLHKTRKNIVFGENNPNADLVFVGEAPGEQEDIKSRPFVGKSGQFLTDCLNYFGIKRHDVFITNLIQCRPPNNRNPSEYEIKKCSPFLIRKIKIINPKAIISLGRFSSCFLSGMPQSSSMSYLRDLNLKFENIQLFATYHPSYVLRKEGKFNEKGSETRKVLFDIEKALKQAKV